MQIAQKGVRRIQNEVVKGVCCKITLKVLVYNQVHNDKHIIHSEE